MPKSFFLKSTMVMTLEMRTKSVKIRYVTNLSSKRVLSARYNKLSDEQKQVINIDFPDLSDCEKF